MCFSLSFGLIRCFFFSFLIPKIMKRMKVWGLVPKLDLWSSTVHLDHIFLFFLLSFRTFLSLVLIYIYFLCIIFPRFLIKTLKWHIEDKPACRVLALSESKHEMLWKTTFHVSTHCCWRDFLVPVNVGLTDFLHRKPSFLPCTFQTFRIKAGYCFSFKYTQLSVY